MAYLKIECSVARNRKFVKAGPAPSWLWVCGLAYCQEGLTDGFIPSEALNYLGVKNPRQLAHHLVAAGLWDETEGGWQVHDYLEHNRSAAEVDDLKRRRGDGGKAGGRPSRNHTPKPSETLKVSGSETLCQTFPVAVADVAAVVDLSGGGVGEFPGDRWWAELCDAYPPQRVTRNHIANQAFISALLAAKDGPHAAWTRMRGNLDNQQRGHEWRVKGMVPSLQKWLESGAWEQQHDETPPSVLVNDRTAGTMAAAAAVRGMRR